ncbi:radical SAM protein, partial [bacterium]|nr:radical SAM protein [bacterium]
MLDSINKEKFEKTGIDAKKLGFEDAVIAVTYRCNSRCRMCDIWKKNPGIENELQLSDYYKLPQTLKNVNISGGEPFLKENLEEIIEAINKTCNFPKIIISTNGLLPEIITEKTRKILKLQKNNIGIAVSIDGIGENHNRIRGIDNAFDKAIETLVSLKKLKVKNLKIAFTAGDYNINQLKKVYQLSRKLNVEFSLAVVHSS